MLLALHRCLATLDVNTWRSMAIELKTTQANLSNRFGATAEDFAEIARINHEHSQRNPYSQFHDVYTLDQIQKSPMIHEPLTKLQCCPTSDGGAAAVLVSQSFLDARPHLKEQAVLIAGQCLATDLPGAFSQSMIDLMGRDMTQRANKIAMKEA